MPGASDAKAGSRVWRFLRWPLLAIVALLLVAAASNAFDEDIAPLTAQLLTPAANSLPDADNLYVLLAGLDAPAGRSILDQGLANTRAFNEALQKAAHSSDVPLGVGKTPESTRYVIDLGLQPWSTVENSVWDRVKLNELNVAALTTKYADGLARYRQLQRTKGYYEVNQAAMSMLIYAPDAQLRSLFLSQVAHELQSGQAERQRAALADLSRDFSTWLRMLRGEGSLVSKMLAVAYLHGNLIVLADAAADPAVPVDVMAAGARDMLELVPAEGWQMGNVWAHELRFQADVLRSLASSPADFPHGTDALNSTAFQRAKSRAASYFYLPNDTLNLSAQQFDEFTRIALGSVESLDARLSSFGERAGANNTLGVLGMIRNPFGKTILKISAPAYKDYALRPFDVAAYQRAVRLAFELRRTKTDTANFVQFSQEHPEWSKHPVSNKSFVLNDRGSAIIVAPLGRASRQRRFDVRLFGVKPVALADERQ
jgi:hypothetical protein